MQAGLRGRGDAGLAIVAGRTTSRPKTPTAFDESVSLTEVVWDRSGRMPPSLYVDDFTVMRECTDLRALRAGDHCMTGLNVLHRLCWPTDALCSLLTSWEIHSGFYHHLIVMADVATVDAEGRPLDAEGRPVLVAEFSDSVASGLRRLTADGLWPTALLRNFRNFSVHLRLPPLSDYVPFRTGTRGIFVISQALTAAQRRRTVEAARALHKEAPTYGVFNSNCEHLAWQLDGSGLGPSGRWVSPQIPHNLWVGFRLLLQLVGLVCLRMLASAEAVAAPGGGGGVRGGGQHDGDAAESAAASYVWLGLYHLFVTLPVGAQVQACLVRTCVNLTTRRRAGQLEPGAYEFLMVKEGARAGVVLLVATSLALRAPRLCASHFRAAAGLSLCCNQLALLAYNLGAQLVIRGLLASGLGVPWPVFEDMRISDGQQQAQQQQQPPPGPAAFGATTVAPSGYAAPRATYAADASSPDEPPTPPPTPPLPLAPLEGVAARAPLNRGRRKSRGGGHGDGGSAAGRRRPARSPAPAATRD